MKANSGTVQSFSGISNPYALAELVEGRKINWEKKTYEDKKKKLENIFAMPYDELFDPKTKSPLFSPGSFVDTCKLTSVYGAGSTCVTPSNYLDFSAVVPMVTSHNIRDPVQGSIPNCWLIAAMASVAWAASVAYVKSLDANKKPQYQFTFYSGTKQKPTSALLPTDAGGNPLYCRSSTSGELWPSLYEKAYYQWRVLNDSGVDTQKPDYCQYTTNNPMQGVSHLTGKVIKSVDILTKELDPDVTLADACFSELFSLSGPCGRGEAIKKMPKVSVAWTYDTTNMPSGYQSVYGTTDPGYSTGTLPSCHCYSVLGTSGAVTASPDDKYIILRNPYGPPVGDPNLAGILSAGTFCASINLADKDAIFGISATEFVKKFEGYGWGI